MDLKVDKAICLVIFFLATLGPGALTVLLFSRCQERLTSRRGSVTLSLLKCFAGGVFLATCLLNLLHEGLDEYEDFKKEAKFAEGYPFFHLSIGVGFFLVAYMERVAFWVTNRHSTEKDLRRRGGSRGGGDAERRRRDGNVDGVAEFVKMETFENKGETDKPQEKAVRSEAETNTELSETTQTDSVTIVVSAKEMTSMQNGHPTASNAPPTSPDAPSAASTATTTSAPGADIDPHSHNQHRHHNDTSTVAERRHSTQSHASVQEEERTSGIRAIIFLLALSFHTLFDGLAVGLQDTESDIWAMTVAIVIHKVIMVVSLALEMAMSLKASTVRIILFLFLFALMAPVGIAIGMSVTSGHVNLRAQLLTGSVLQGVAAGSVLFVTFMEILSEELGHHSSTAKVTVTGVGFAAITVAKIWDTD